MVYNPSCMHVLFLNVLPDGISGNRGAGAHEHALRLLETRGVNGVLGEKGGRLTRQLLENGVPGEDGAPGVGALSILASALEAFRPDLVMFSVGLDGRKGYPCGLGELLAEDYEWMTREVSGIEVLDFFENVPVFNI